MIEQKIMVFRLKYFVSQDTILAIVLVLPRRTREFHFVAWILLIGFFLCVSCTIAACDRDGAAVVAQPAAVSG